MMFIPHKNHRYGPTRSVTGRALLYLIYDDNPTEETGQTRGDMGALEVSLMYTGYIPL
jgi:hypothetical protein